ncbi:hypothetical protein H257_01990 [Aphanomyces astaci]|uniref:DUF659 domain-containing protein n=1 Tax=Aphanomyces astaci TaxID=112090 RepID=W4H4Y5_APHAT|nr:hypothetical protein H257_01990 [Aphanomyces astaci]ETV86972.1 hypothetical protein H257_01990 [Aphanomyces astaci]|eukprot:XP_009823771.1 hypothetical protein H257_01990 [Aphanomyces astaci]
MEYLDVILGLYNRTTAVVSFLVAGNCSFNRKMSRDMMVPLVGCASHRLNLAVRKMVSTHFDDVIQKVQTLMVALTNLNNSVAFRRLTAPRVLLPKLQNVTRWSSTYSMLELYFLLLPYLAKMPLLSSDWRQLRLTSFDSKKLLKQ